ncbi:MAG TPA: hypothetical protein VGF98_10925 [Candidatus Tumulicola sp.]
MKLVINIMAAILVGGGFAACSGVSNEPMTANTTSLTSVAGLAQAAGAKSNGRTLYAMNSDLSSGGFSIAVYSSGGAKLLRTISVPKSGSPAFGVGTDGLLYESVYGGNRHSRPVLRIYGKRGSKLVDTWRHQKPAYVDITPDASGNLYTTCGITVCEYNVLGKVSRKFPHATSPLAVDNSGDVSVSDCGGKGYNGVECVFAPGQSKPYWTANAGTVIDDAAFDPAGNLYVAVAGENGAVEEFAPNAEYATRTLTDGIVNPYALAFDASGNAYVLNQGKVTVFPPTGTEPIRSITQGVGGCGLHSACIHPIAFDGTGSLYVANYTANNITVYAPNGSTPIRTITVGIESPIGLAIGP